jgi:hypothetical protein
MDCGELAKLPVGSQKRKDIRVTNLRRFKTFAGDADQKKISAEKWSMHEYVDEYMNGQLLC